MAKLLALRHFVHMPRLLRKLMEISVGPVIAASVLEGLEVCWV
jgi:hypothetical protein